MSEFRQDRTSGAWVIIAPERGLRPQASAPPTHTPDAPPEFDAHCPFCPGNEAELPAIVAEVPNTSSPGWRMRVVPNKYPVVRPSLPSIPQPVGPHITMTSHGHHELIIESPKHNANPTSFADDHIAELISTYRQRFDDLLARPGIKTVILFRNYGAASGASLRHPHSQIIALGMTPPRLRSLADRMQQCWDETGRCASCDELKLARADGTRVVTETSSFLAMVPFAASAPFETWIIPKRHQTSFTEISSAECPDFGRTLRSALRRLRSACNDPPYNLVVESFDFLRRPARHAHWRLRIVPSLATWGGFELASGISINPASPEENADLLRNAVNV